METWKIFLMALGIVLVIEGTPYAFFPGGMKKTLGQILLVSNGPLRVLGFLLISLGFLLVFLVRWK